MSGPAGETGATGDFSGRSFSPTLSHRTGFQSRRALEPHREDDQSTVGVRDVWVYALSGSPRRLFRARVARRSPDRRARLSCMKAQTRRAMIKIARTRSTSTTSPLNRSGLYSDRGCVDRSTGRRRKSERRLLALSRASVVEASASSRMAVLATSL